MNQFNVDPAIEFMRDLDRRFREVSGLTDRRDYSIFYSRLQRARVMVIGIKPGGRRDRSHQLANQSSTKIGAMNMSI